MSNAGTQPQLADVETQLAEYRAQREKLMAQHIVDAVIADAVAQLADDKAQRVLLVQARRLHFSTSQLNLSCYSHCNHTMHPMKVLTLRRWVNE